jgi:hypothetical protein
VGCKVDEGGDEVKECSPPFLKRGHHSIQSPLLHDNDPWPAVVVECTLYFHICKILSEKPCIL